MRLENWFISNPDESQIKVLNTPINENIVVHGVAGSGKTNMAVYRARLADSEPFAIIVYTIALKKMVKFGLDKLGLDKNTVVHEWSWINRGFDVTGDVYCLKGTNPYNLNSDLLILQNDQIIETFIPREQYDQIIDAGKYMNYNVQIPEDQLEVSIDFSDWVPNEFYYTFYRRARWFKKINLVDFIFQPQSVDTVPIPSGFLFKESGSPSYIIIDEGQDFSIEDYNKNFIPRATKAVSIFGDSAQLIYPDRGVTINSLIQNFKYKSIPLAFNYRTPKTIAKVAQKIINSHLKSGDSLVDLISNNRKNQGNSDFPTYPKPTIKKCSSFEDELDYIIRVIQLEDLDDVAILLPNNDIIERVHTYFSNHDIKTQVKYTVSLPENIQRGIYPTFKTIDTLDFSNNDNPTILSYHSAKGTEFDNVFIPFANEDDVFSINPFYVAVTRSHSKLYFTYSRRLTKYLSAIDSSLLNILNQ